MTIRDGAVAVPIVRFVRRLRGGSQPILAKGADGLLYVVKFKDNLQGANLLFNECMGSALFRACGLSVPRWRVVRLTREFLDLNRGCWIETAEGRQRPQEGLCFGSCFLEEKEQRLFEVLPGTYLSRIRNRWTFWLAWLIDICFEHTDHRQAIFRMDQKGILEAVFIDMGNMFGGAQGGQNSHFLASRYLDPRIYADIGSKERDSILKIVHAIDQDKLWHGLEHIPSSWKPAASENSLKRGLDRLGNVSLLEEVLNAMIESQRRRTERYRELAQTRNAVSGAVLYP